MCVILSMLRINIIKKYIRMNIYEVTIGTYARNLKNLLSIVEKAESWAKERNISDETLLNARLTLDQFPLVKQVQIASDQAKGSAAALANIPVPSFPDTEATVQELKERITKTIDFLSTISPDMIDETTLVTRTVPNRYVPGKGFTVYNHAFYSALPQFFFHYVTAYSILRHYGVQVGKADFNGDLPLIDVA